MTRDELKDKLRAAGWLVRDTQVGKSVVGRRGPLALVCIYEGIELQTVTLQDTRKIGDDQLHFIDLLDLPKVFNPDDDWLASFM